ncbi:glycosyltransferase [Halorubrum sp. GN11GM_10-3_MGM]|uniref:glycosyltransferase n=1 Tax=Halorubrum sp. GN11GM_10-3_MGM TaxID=2518111 RepID=UPI0010F715EE|nr:hypothetical protein [Halorubrum sp. GN11GM_10-3_MGM]TKX69204.1 hypothetical protein EXE40_11265 [Halorubrum sp. GN11GM_10-3_MGM]
MEPWSFGLTNRLLNYTEGFSDYERSMEILVNFRVNHYLRDVGILALKKCANNTISLNYESDPMDHVPQSKYDKFLWERTGRRHYPTYFKKLKRTRAIAAFGGYYVPPILREKYSSMNYIYNTILSYAPNQIVNYINMSNNIFQWDSYRLWEAWASGCVPIHVDFEKYGIKMPETPDNYKHYIGLDPASPNPKAADILRNQKTMESISNAGREWCIRNYSPSAQAKRFLDQFERS